MEPTCSWRTVCTRYTEWRSTVGSAHENRGNQETVLTTSRFAGGKLKEVRLYPVDLGGSRRPISQMGIPLTPSCLTRTATALLFSSCPFARSRPLHRIEQRDNIDLGVAQCVG
jgi:hypothetical protein